jgi:hypothetical protein
MFALAKWHKRCFQVGDWSTTKWARLMNGRPLGVTLTAEFMCTHRPMLELSGRLGF